MKFNDKIVSHPVLCILFCDSQKQKWTDFTFCSILQFDYYTFLLHHCYSPAPHPIGACKVICIDEPSIQC